MFGFFTPKVWLIIGLGILLTTLLAGAYFGVNAYFAHQQAQIDAANVAGKKEAEQAISNASIQARIHDLTNQVAAEAFRREQINASFEGTRSEVAQLRRTLANRNLKELLSKKPADAAAAVNETSEDLRRRFLNLNDRATAPVKTPAPTSAQGDGK